MENISIFTSVSHISRPFLNDNDLLFCAEKGGDPELIRESQRRRFADVGLVDKVLELDLKWREGESVAIHTTTKICATWCMRKPQSHSKFEYSLL